MRVKPLSGWVIVWLILSVQITTIAHAYHNPIHPQHPDPFILKYNGTYYLYETSRQVQCYSSRNLVDWELVGSAAPDMDGTPCAPEVFYWNGLFYLYTAIRCDGHTVWTSTSPTGPFTLQTENFGHNIDGSVFIDDDGKWYFYHADAFGLYGYPMSDPFTIEDEKGVWLQATNMHWWTEGPFMIKRNGTYYLTYTGNHYLSFGYRINAATSTSGPLGPFSASPQNPILLSSEGPLFGLGHSMTVRGPNLDEYYIVYHNIWPDKRQRDANIDRIVWNGDTMVVLGSTAFEQVNPVMPDFSDCFDRKVPGAGWKSRGEGSWLINDSGFLALDSSGTDEWNMLVCNEMSAAEYTAEFNVRLADGRAKGENHRFGAVFSYGDEKNYGIALLNGSANRLETQVVVEGKNLGWETLLLPQKYDYTRLHTIRVEKYQDTVSIYVDGIFKQTRDVPGLKGGGIGYAGEDVRAEFGYIAFTNQVGGSSAYDMYKPIPGRIEGVHFITGGENVGFHAVSSSQANKYRAEEIAIGPGADGGYKIRLEDGEWLKYNVRIEETGVYNVGIRTATEREGVRVVMYQDDAPIANEGLPNTNSFSNLCTVTMQGLALRAGNHVLKVEAAGGALDLHRMLFFKADNTLATLTDTFDNDFSGDWNYIDGDWYVAEGLANIDGTGKRTLGSTGWTDYTIECDVRGSDNSMNCGIIFRVTNPALGGPGDSPEMGADFFQGYLVALTRNAVSLVRYNYDRTLLMPKRGAYADSEWHHLKIVVEGCRYRVYVDDMNTAVIDYTDTSSRPFLHGKVGIRSLDSLSSFDNFIVTTHTSTD